MSDDFPEMPTRRCPDCGVVKKLMFFAKNGTYCRMCAAARNAGYVARNTVPADEQYQLSSKTQRGTV